MPVHITSRSDAEAIIREQVVSTIFQDAPKQSVFMSMARKLPNMTSDQTRIRVLDFLPTAYWVDGDTGMKQTSRQAWDNVYLDAAELAVIVPIPEAVLDDAEFDIFGEITPRVNEAIGQRVDSAIIFGVNRPRVWQNDIITLARQAGNNVAPGSTPDYYNLLLGENGVISKVEEDGYMATGALAAMGMRAKLRAWWTKTDRMKELKKINLGYLLLSTLFYYSTVWEDIEWLCYLLYYGIPFLYLCYHYEWVIDCIRICMRSCLKYYLGAILFMALLSLVLPCLYQTYDFSYFLIRILQIGKEGLKILFLFLIFIRYISPEGDYLLFMKYFVLATCMYILGTCVIIAIPGLRDLLLQLNKADENTIRLAYLPSYITRFGWCGFSGFTYTLRCSLAAMFLCYIIYLQQEQSFTFHTILLMIVILGNFFYGRIGIAVTAIYVFLLFVVLWMKKRMLWKRLLLMMVITCGMLSIAFLLSEQVRIWLRWVFQSFINYSEQGSFSTTSTQSLKEMYFTPNGKTLLLGDGYYTDADGLYYMGTDVGLFRAVLFGGIGFQMLRYTLLGSLLFEYKRCLPVHLHRLLLLLPILFIIYEMKGESICPIISILFGVALLITYQKERKKSGETYGYFHHNSGL